ncbi:ABC transporter permease [Paucibacter sp. APW11]|uniref:ABC transporter permease n=1 Tax=Roseateles aquae TaxID=3077235 RepID=A0ABU3PGU7_9BURK|nr:ABC transporter permease [Paucibacter sp. APW11]MDT9001763.1 ABC transporter permease [Paucibacter sp. APW11]
MRPARERFAARALGHPGFVAGGLLCALLLAAGLISLLWTPWPPEAIDLARKLAPPDAQHWLGCDALGRDIASLLLAGALNALKVGLLAAGLAALMGSALGLLAAALGGWPEALIMRGCDLGQAFPALLLAIILAATRGPGLAIAITAIALHGVPAFARLARASARVQWQLDHVRAARAFGRGPLAIAWVHVLPAIAPLLIVQASSQFALAILSEAALAYLGLGTQAPEASWGRMLAEAQGWLFSAPLLAVWPGLAIALAVLGLNLLGDALRDLLDPRMP